MRRLKLIVAMLAITMLVSGCNKSEDITAQPETTTPPVGDFNFIAQGTTSSTVTPVSPGNTTDVGQDANMGGSNGEGAGITPDMDTQSQATEQPNNQQQTPEEEEPGIVYISPYEDLSSNLSIQIGDDVYVSVPSSIMETTCGLDLFLETYRLAHTLVNEEDYGDKDVVASVYKNGTCLDINNSTLYINGQGIGYWCKNIQGSMDLASSPTISLFNLGKLKGAKGSMNARYSELGEKLDSEDNDYFYKAIYTIKDVEGTATQARAVLIYNKQTSAISTCLIYLNSEYCADTTANIDLLASSVRFSTVAPDNYVTLF